MQHVRVSHNAHDTQDRQHQKPDQHYRRKEFTHHTCAMLLNGKQQRQHRNRHRHNKRIQRRRGNLKAFDGGHHRNGWRDHHLSIEEAATNQAHDHQHRRGACTGMATCQRHQGQNPAFPGVVGAHHITDVLQ